MTGLIRLTQQRHQQPRKTAPPKPTEDMTKASEQASDTPEPVTPPPDSHDQEQQPDR